MFIWKSVVIFAFFCMPVAFCLRCFSCNDCDRPVKIICNATEAKMFTDIVKEYFDFERLEETKTFDCMTLAYMSKTGRPYGKIRGCTFNSTYACSLKAKSPDYSYICYTCNTDFCNSSGNYTNAQIILTLVGTILTAFVAYIL